jgi:DNA-binding Lrp family transcriptional regulator
VTPPPVDPTALDIDMIRELYREGSVTVAGVDPRLNATRIAQRLHVGRRRVAARLKVWKEVGFLRRYDVWPNPALLGAQGAWLSVRVDHPRRKPALIEHLGLVDGVVSALDFVGEWFTVGLLVADEGTLARKMALIRGLAGVADLEGPAVWEATAPVRPLTPLDLRIVRALRDRPDATLRDTARRVGISTRTMTRRYAQLLDDSAVWFVPIFDFTALLPPVIALNLTIRAGTSQAAVARALRRRFPLVLESRAMGTQPDTGSSLVPVYVTLPSAARVEELHRYAESLEGVESVELLTMVRLHSFPEWFDRHLAGLIAAATPSEHRRRRANPA